MISGLTAPGPDGEVSSPRIAGESSDDEEDQWKEKKRVTSTVAKRKPTDIPATLTRAALEEALKPLKDSIEDTKTKVTRLHQLHAKGLNFAQTIVLVAIFLAAQALMFSYFLKPPNPSKQ